MKSLGIIVALSAILGSELVASIPYPEDSIVNLVGATRTSGVRTNVPSWELTPPAAHSREIAPNRFSNEYVNARRYISENANFQRNHNYEQLQRTEFQKQFHRLAPIITNNAKIEGIASNINVNRRIPIALKKELGNVRELSPNFFAQTRQAIEAKQIASVNNARSEQVAFGNTRRPLLAKIGIPSNPETGYAVSPKHQRFDHRPGFTRDLLKYQMGQNMQEIFNRPEVKKAIESKTDKKRYLVVYPDGRIEHVNELETIAQQHPNYVLINGKMAMENIQTNKANNQAVLRENSLKSSQHVVTDKSEPVIRSKLPSITPSIEVSKKVTPILTRKIVPSKTVDVAATTVKAAPEPIIKANPGPQIPLKLALHEKPEKLTPITQTKPNSTSKTTVVEFRQTHVPIIAAEPAPVNSLDIPAVVPSSQKGITPNNLAVDQPVQNVFKTTDVDKTSSNNIKAPVPNIAAAPESGIPSTTLLAEISKNPVASLIKLPPVSQSDQKVKAGSSLTSSSVSTKTKEIPKTLTTSSITSSNAALTSQSVTPPAPSPSISATNEQAQVKIKKSVPESQSHPSKPATSIVDSLVTKAHVIPVKPTNLDKVDLVTTSSSNVKVDKTETPKISSKIATTSTTDDAKKFNTTGSRKIPKKTVASSVTEDKISNGPVIKQQPIISKKDDDVSKEEVSTTSTDKVVPESVENKSINENSSSSVTEAKNKNETENDILFVVSNEEDSSSVKKVAAIPTTVSKAESVGKAETVTAKEADPSKGPVVWFRTTEPDFLDKLMGDNNFLGAIYFFQVKSSN